MTQHSSLPNDMQVHLNRDGRVFIKLPEPYFKGRRCIGRIENGTFHTERNPKLHLMRTLQAYGFNHDFVLHGGFEPVVVHTPNEVLRTTRQTILDYGKVLYFKGKGFERQIFLKLADFGKPPKFRVLPVVTESKQLGLFATAAM